MLLGKEEVFMNVLWDGGKPMSSMDILEAAPVGEWEEKNDKNIHRIIRQLLKKDMIEVCGQVLSGAHYARLFRPTITREDYAVRQLSGNNRDSMIKIAIGLTKAAKNKGDSQKGISEEMLEELKKMVQDFEHENEENEGGKEKA